MKKGERERERERERRRHKAKWRRIRYLDVVVDMALSTKCSG